MVSIASYHISIRASEVPAGGYRQVDKLMGARLPGFSEKAIDRPAVELYGLTNTVVRTEKVGTFRDYREVVFDNNSIAFDIEPGRARLLNELQWLG